MTCVTRLILAILILLGSLPCCVSSKTRANTSRHPYYDLKLPEGWEEERFPNRGLYKIVLRPKEVARETTDYLVIAVTAFGGSDHRFPHTQEGISESEFSGLLTKMGDDVKKETIGSVHNAHYGQIMIYRYHSPYIGEWYVAALPKSWGYVKVELRAHPPTNPECYRDEFLYVVENIKLPRSVPKEEMKKKGRVIGGAR